jgi:3-phenylpropionate/trans-cinnamate dioxygenase ferredoxin reductase subunit/anthranilate 1,2-dioxygenase ferredoxin reductase subunit
MGSISRPVNLRAHLKREGKMKRFVVVGGGVAGHRAAIELARRAPASTIDLISEEPCLPYDRPPLSKDLLHGTKTAEQIVLPGATAYQDNNIRYHSGTWASAIDRSRQIVTTKTGETIDYDQLLLATGSRPRRLPPECTGDAQVHYLRSLHDAIALAPQLASGRRILIIGGGFIGLEVAAAAARRNCQVTVLESQPRILARGMPTAVSDWVERVHRSEGIDIRPSTNVHLMRRDHSEILVASSKGMIAADVVIAGIGALPNIEIAAEAGLEVSDGLVVDNRCQTSDPKIFGAGEVTCRPMMIGPSRRIESWKSSGEQGAIAAQAMTGADVTFDEIPSLWSDQFDINIQSIGLPDLGVTQEILGDPATRAWTLVSLGEDGTIVGGVAINRGRDASALRRAIKQRAGLAFMQPNKVA